jgi:hypothetical protein
MASLFPLHGFICPPRLSTAGAEIVVMLNIRGSVVATPEHGPSRIQPALDLNRDFLIGAGQKPDRLQTPGDGRSWSSKSCSHPKAAQ